MASFLDPHMGYRPLGTAPTPLPPTAPIDAKTITTSTLSQLQANATTDASKAWMRNSAINAVRAGNVGGAFSLASWIYSSGWSTADAWAKSIGKAVAFYVLIMSTLCATKGVSCAVSTIDAHMLYSHF